VRAAQGTSVERKMERVLSLSVSMILQPKQAGTLQPYPSRRGMKAFPCTPTLCISPSIRKAALARYPVSSSRVRST
jgi:hypothetical protein